MNKTLLDFPMEKLPERTRGLLMHLQWVSTCPMSVIFAHVLFLVSVAVQRRFYVAMKGQLITRSQMFFIEMDDGAYEKEKLDIRKAIFQPIYEGASNPHPGYLESCNHRRLDSCLKGKDYVCAVLDDKMGKTLRAADLKVLGKLAPLWGDGDRLLSSSLPPRFGAGTSFYLSASPSLMERHIMTDSVGAGFFNRSVMVFPSQENVFITGPVDSWLGEAYKRRLQALFYLDRRRIVPFEKLRLEVDFSRWESLKASALHLHRSLARLVDNPKVSTYIKFQEENALKMAICLAACETVMEGDPSDQSLSFLYIPNEILESALALQAWFVDCYLRAFVPEYAYFLERDSHIEAMNQYLLRRFEEKQNDPDWVRYDKDMECYVFKIAKQEIRKFGPGTLRERAVLDFMINVMKDLGLVHVDKAYKGKHWCYFAMRPETGLVRERAGPAVAAFRWRDFQPFGVGSKEAALQERFPAPEFVDTGRFRQLPKP